MLVNETYYLMLQILAVGGIIGMLVLIWAFLFILKGVTK